MWQVCIQIPKTGQQHKKPIRTQFALRTAIETIIAMKVSSNIFRRLGTELVSKRSKPLDDRFFVAFYGSNPDVVADFWDMLIPRKPKAARPKHLLWALMFMKLYIPEDALMILLDASKETVRKWTWFYIEEIALLSEQVIDFQKRNRNLPPNVWCRMSVDGTDFKVQEPQPKDKKRMMSPKFKGSGVKYEVGISIYSGDIVWVHGPHRGGKHDITIFRENLKHALEEDEMAECDQGYIGEGNHIRVRDDYTTEEERREKTRLRLRHETCNRRFKVYGILKQEYRHDRKKHVLVFHAIACLTQINIDNGNCLFGCEPVAKKKKEYTLDDLDLDFSSLKVLE